MKVTQISIFLENKSGRLAHVTSVLGENGINIRALSIADTTDFGILRVIVDQPKKAHEILEKEDFMVNLTEVLAVEMPDRPGGLAEIMQLLSRAGINIEYLYAFIGQPGQDAIVIFRVEKLDRAIDILSENEIRIVPGEEVYNL